MKYSQLLFRQLVRGMSIALLAIGFAAVAMAAGRMRNNGKILNNNGSTISAPGFNNGKNGTGGIIRNAGTISITNGGGFFNYDSVSSNGPGQFFNVYGAGLGSGGNLNGAVTFNNGTGTSQGTFLNDSAATANSGKVQIGGTFSNGSAASFTSLIGTVNYNGAAQTVSELVASNTYGSLLINGSATKTLNNNITVAGALAVNAGTFDEAGKTLTLNGTVSGAGILLASGVSSTTIYNASGAQNVLGATYYNLQLKNTGTKTAQGAISLVAGGNLQTVTVSDSLDLAAFWFSDSSTATITNNGKIMAAGVVKLPAANTTIGGTFVYYGTTTLGNANYSNLTLRNANTFTMPAGTVAVGGTYKVEGVPTSIAYTTNSGTFAYSGASAQTILGGATHTYFKLNVTGSADTSIANAKTANGAINITANAAAGFFVLGNTTMDMQSNTISLGAGAVDSVQGGARIRWSSNNAFVGGSGLTELYGASGIIAVTAGNGYGALLLSNSAGACTLAGNVTVSLGTTPVSTAIGLTNAGSLTVAGGQTLTVTGMDLSNNGLLTNSGTITVN